LLTANYARVDAENQSTGKPPQGQPENTMTVSATLFLPVADSLVGTFHLNGRYADESYQQAAGIDKATGAVVVPDYYGERYTTVNARLSLSNQEGSWSASIFAQNLTDKIAALEGFTQVLAPATSGNIMTFPGLPRMYGAEVRFNF
jgi:hypothetical protein